MQRSVQPQDVAIFAVHARWFGPKLARLRLRYRRQLSHYGSPQPPLLPEDVRRAFEVALRPAPARPRPACPGLVGDGISRREVLPPVAGRSPAPEGRAPSSSPIPRLV